MLDKTTAEFLEHLGIDPSSVEVANITLDLDDPEQRVQYESFALMYPLVITSEGTGMKCQDPECECGGKNEMVGIRVMSSLVN